MRIAHFIFGLFVSSAMCRAAGDFSQYQVILDRMPFGAEAPVGAVAAVVAVTDAESFIKTLKMTAITKNDITGSVCVGIVDMSTKKNYFLTVGDEEDGIALVESDYDHDRALLRKAGDSRWISMGETVGGAASPSASAAASLPISPERYSFNQARARGPSPEGHGMSLEEYERRRPTLPQPVSPMRKHRLGTRAEIPKLSPADIEERLRSYNMDLIRAGGENGVPLPIPLSPEEDAQLVQEGVLAP